MSRINICGLNGSGKTTLGAKLAEILNYKHKDIEDYYFNNNDNYKYSSSLTKAEVTQMLEQDFEMYDNIILTSCKGDYGNLSNKYDLVIFIRLDRESRMKRVKERSYKQFGDRILENGDLFDKENEFFSKVYKRREDDIIQWYEKLTCNKMEIDGIKPVDENVRLILNKLNEQRD